MNMDKIIDKIDELAKTHAIHPAWGLNHCIRVKELAMRIAEKEGMKIDLDVLYIAAILHDFGAYPAFRKENKNHSDSSAEFAERQLKEYGLEEEKIKRIVCAISGHMFDATPDISSNEAVVLHDADVLDFLGAIGISRIYSIIGIDDWAKDMDEAHKLLENFRVSLPSKLITKTAKEIAAIRVAEMDVFFSQLDAESNGGKHK
jgi:uncharacterized protein